MTTKEYLGQIKKIDEYVKGKLRDIDELRDSSESISSMVFDKDRVVSSKSRGQLENIVTKIVDMDRQVGIFLDLRNKIMAQLESLDADEYKVLYMRYVRCFSFPVIVEMLGIEGFGSESKIYRAHKQGLENFELKFGETYM